ncbi:hypothetical protein RPMA_02505 [Tardiphaga alba]|uniref:Uncharacterized protein n=1 Tax=Tardiphaga alba TaxID=340268 RepID=A0ABX8A2T1_9BRAD|nr:hypothetical protein [Tardiphaga alba]QUS37853.1 hypothetical protein RPMA_02505 [Tardiphaga alba]
MNPKAPSLYARIQAHGTLTESPRDVPDARFALPSTINWMRALAILCGDRGVDFATAKVFYVKTQARQMPEAEVNTVSEQLLFALNQIAALRAMSAAPNKADVARAAIIAWYYGVYSAASAMTAAMDGSFQDNHTETARKWDERFPANGMAMAPFADRLTNLVSDNIKAELAPLKSRGVHSLVNKPTEPSEAGGCCTEYLSGTARWQQWNVDERIKAGRQFKELGVADFRTKAAREIRDAAYAKNGIAFLHQASRYRTKANYRDAIFLAYGVSVPALLTDFVEDLMVVLEAFAAMAGGYCSVRLGRARWDEFVGDLELKRAVSVSPNDIWPRAG